MKSSGCLTNTFVTAREPIPQNIRAAGLLLCTILLIVSPVGMAQSTAGNATGLTLSGVTTNALPTPGAPTTFGSNGCGTSTYYMYEVVAVDFTSGITPYGASAPSSPG